MIKKHIPNAITCGNLLCGCLAIVKSFEGDLVWAAYLVGIAAVLDFLDGLAARLLKVSSPIGKDLDSLADMVTFGVVPGVVMFQLTGGGYISFIITIFSAIRLAKFNNDTNQSDSFIGLPTPANAIFICSIPLILKMPESVFIGNILSFLLNPYVLCVMSCVLSLLLIAPIPLFALKFKNFGWADNKIRFILVGLAFVMLACFQFVGIPLVIILYILLSVINNLFFKKEKNV